MKRIEVSAKTVEEAIELGLEQLGLAIGDVEVQVVEEGSKGLFGLFGSRLARVALTVKEDESDPLEDLIAGEAKSAPAADRPPKAPRPAPEKKEPAEAPAAEEPARKETPRPAPVRRTAAKKQDKKPPKEPVPAPEADLSDAEEPAKEAEKPEIRTLEKPEITVIPEDRLDPESPAGIAFSFLREITRLMGVEVSIEIGTDPEGNVCASMTGDTLGILIGRRGETLDALQYLTSLRVNRGREGYIRVTLDTENYRARREDTLIRLANRMANRALRTGRRVSLEPMNPYERRIIHYALQQNESVGTHSEGDEPNRHVVITVKK